MDRVDEAATQEAMLIQMRVTKLFSGDEEKWMDESQRRLGDRKNKTCGLKRGVGMYMSVQMHVQDSGEKCKGENRKKSIQN